MAPVPFVVQDEPLSVKRTAQRLTRNVRAICNTLCLTYLKVYGKYHPT